MTSCLFPQKDLRFFAPCSSEYQTTPFRWSSVRLKMFPFVNSFRYIFRTLFQPHTIPHPVSYTHLDVYKRHEYVRAGNGPMILELKTWRQMGHAPNEPGTKYKDPAEQAMWLKRDPIKLLATKLKEQYQVQDEQIKEIEDRVCLLYTSRCV